MKCRASACLLSAREGQGRDLKSGCSSLWQQLQAERLCPARGKLNNIAQACGSHSWNGSTAPDHKHAPQKSHPHPQPSSGRREMGRLNCTKDTATVHTPRGVIRASAGDDVSSENGQEQPIHEALPRVRKTGPGPYHSARLGPTRSPPLRLQHRDAASWPARHQIQVRARAMPLRCLSFFSP